MEVYRALTSGELPEKDSHRQLIRWHRENLRPNLERELKMSNALDSSLNWNSCQNWRN